MNATVPRWGVIFIATVLVLGLGACGGDGNNAPVADAGPDQTTTALAGDVVVLDGSASLDADGDPLSYSWSLTALPADSTATLSDPTLSTPNFVADKAGEYIAQLKVNDGRVDSAPDEVSVTVRVPPPTVSITAPENLSVVTESPVTVTGTVDDPDATITANGAAAANNSGSYTTAVSLQEGSNTVTVVGRNGTGEGSASVEVILNTVDAPALSITSHKNGFVAGEEFEVGAAFHAAQVTVAGVIKVNTIAFLPANNKPTVTVNGVAADVVLSSFFGPCGLVFPLQCWTFTAAIALDQGDHVITAVGTDQHEPPRSTTVSVEGTVDYCRIGVWEKPGLLQPWEPTAVGKDSGVLALAGINRDIQGNRCHEIDGCSAPLAGSLANDPLPLANRNLAPTDFGRGTQPPGEHFVHGLRSASNLPCNNHDVCYQTCVPEAQREQAWRACNAQQYTEMLAVCRRAYPAECPFTILGTEIKDPIACADWFVEKAKCYDAAFIYTLGVESNKGRERFLLRQEHYCAN